MSSEIRREIISANGIDFETHVAGDGDHLVLCLHGFPEHAHSWRHQLPALADAGYRAWAPNMRGYGDTTRPSKVSDYAIEHLMDDVAALIDVSGASKVTLVAHDWGGIVAWWFALRLIAPLDGLVVMNLPHPAVAEQRVRRSPRQMLRSWYILLFQLPWLPERLLTLRDARGIGRAFTASAVHPERFSDADLDVYRQAALAPGAMKAMVDYYRAYFRGGGAKRMSDLGYPTITTPTLMIWGEQDVALGKDLTYGTDRHVEDLTLRYLPDASHWVQQDQPEVVNRILLGWLAGDTPSTEEASRG